MKRQQSVAEVELKKRAGQVFGISSARPKTGMYRDEFRQKNEISESSVWQKGTRANEASRYSLYNDSVIIEEGTNRGRSAFPMMTQSEHEGEDSYNVRVDMNKEY